MTSRLNPACPTGSKLQEEFPTRTGIRVVPGKYSVVVTYPTKEGEKREIYKLDIR